MNRTKNRCLRTSLSFALLMIVGLNNAHAESSQIKSSQVSNNKLNDTTGIMSGVSIGINAMYADKGFTDYDNDLAVLPSISYDNGKAYIRGNSLGYHFIKDRKNDLSVFAQYAGASYDPDNANNAYARLDERDASIFAGASYTHLTRFGGVRGQLSTAVTGDSEGSLAGLTYLGRFKRDKLTLFPSVGLKWQDESYNNYYYGVTPKEYENTGIDNYSANASFYPYANVTGVYDLTNELGLFFNQNVAYNPDEVYNSPKVDSRSKYTTTMGLSYIF